MPSDRTEAKKNWLNQHDSLQDELIRLKKEMVKTKEDVLTEIRKDTAPAGPDTTRTIDTPPISTPSEEPIGAVEVPDDDESLPPEEDPVPIMTEVKAEPVPPKERSIREMITAPTTERNDDQDIGPAGSNALPRHPELTSYIAKVMQHESKIKRKKFEREKSTKPPRAEVPTPPKRAEEPSGSPEGPSPEAPQKADERVDPVAPEPETAPVADEVVHDPIVPIPDPIPSEPVRISQMQPVPRSAVRTEPVAFDPGSFKTKETVWRPPAAPSRETRTKSRDVPDEPKKGIMYKIRRLWKKR